MTEDVGVLVDALIRGDREAAYGLVEDQARTTPSSELYQGLFAPAMHEVGERWSQARITVAEEHVATGLMEELLARDYRRVFTSQRASRQTVLMSCLEGERHALGLRMAANLIEGRGFRVVFLGADVPLPEITLAAHQHRPAVIVLVEYGDARGEAMLTAVDRLRAENIAVPVVIGGVGPAWPEQLLQRPGVIEIDDVGEIAGVVEASCSSPGSP